MIPVPAIMRVKEAMKLLQVRDVRTFDAWCVKHNVSVFNDVGGRYVYAEEFLFNVRKPIIEEMKKKYPNWNEKFFLDKLMGKTASSTAFATSDIAKFSLSDYIPQGKNEEMFLRKLIGMSLDKNK